MPDKTAHEMRTEAVLDTHLAKYARNYGLITAAILISFFLLMGLFNLQEITGLRYFNFLFLFGGVMIGLRNFHRDTRTTHTNYWNGFLLAVGISAVSGIVFSTFMYVVMKFIQPEFGAAIINAIDFAEVNVEVLSLVIFIEAIVSGFMVAFIAMQYFKNVE